MLKSSAETLPHDLKDQIAETEASSPMRTGKRTLMLVMLTLIYVLNYLDRQIVVILQEPIKHDFGLKDWELGLLTGASISILYTACGIPIARWIDRGVNRVKLIAAITALWSLMTAVCGFTQNFGQFIVARMGVGLAESGFAPAAHSLLSDLYPLRKRPMAMGLFALGVPAGIMLGLSIGGLIAQHYDWRTALLVVGAPGLLVGLIFRLLAREPARGASEEGPAHNSDEQMPFGEALRALSRRKAYVHVVLGAAGASFASTAIFSWLPSFLIRTHGMTLAEAGLGLGLLAGVSGLAGTALGGWQASRLSRYGMHAMLWAPIVGLVLAIPMILFALLEGTGWTTLWLLLIPLTLNGLWTAPTIALTQSLAPVRARATASAVFIVGANLIGVAAGPIVIGILSDVFAQSMGPNEGLRWALVCAALLFSWGILHFFVAMRALRREAR